MLQLSESQFAAWSAEAAEDVKKRRELSAALRQVRAGAAWSICPRCCCAHAQAARRCRAAVLPCCRAAMPMPVTGIAVWHSSMAAH
eukprot:35016-Prymnesium_polylepis.1